jgi:uncharacterized repeat protein (TIGR03803 family)
MNARLLRAATGGLLCAVLVACGSQAPIGAPGVLPQRQARSTRSTSTTYRLVYSFNGGATDGARPLAGLIDVKGTLYGTTEEGGPVNSALECYGGCGTVFSLTLGGTETVLYEFATGSNAHHDGQYPVAGLVDVGGVLYGTTGGGGTSNRGTVFSIATSGPEQVLHSFGGEPDGSYPYAPLIDVKGMLYGTTINGGTRSSIGGTVFSITTAGTENIVHSFRGPDGQSPNAGVIDVDRTLYGTTYFGGSHKHGTVFAVTTGGAENVLKSFGLDHTGSFPLGPLLKFAGTFYGTTSGGGTFSCGKRRGGRVLRCGTVFSITPGGTETMLHTFGSEGDGRGPSAGLINVGGTFYGTTNGGGAYGMGTVFSITPGGTEKVLHSFGNAHDGTGPDATLTNVNGTLYGTTGLGGDHNEGTVFAFKP